MTNEILSKYTSPEFIFAKLCDTNFSTFATLSQKNAETLCTIALYVDV